MRHFKTLSAALVAAIFVAAAPASATPIHLTYNGSAVGSQNVGYTVTEAPGTSGGASAGGFSMTETGTTNSFVAWCIDLFNNIQSATYNVAQPSQVSAGEATTLNQLFTSYYDVALDSAQNSAAFQLAIWNIVYDTDQTVSGGTFSATGSAGAVGTANTWLSNLGTASNYNLTFYDSTGNPNSQDLVSGVAAVPLPAGAVLLLGGLGAVAALRRRRRTS